MICVVRKHSANVKQEETTFVIGFVIQIVAQIDTVVDWLPWLSVPVTASRSKTLDDTVLHTVQLRFGEIRHTGRKVLQLIGEHAAHLNLNFIHIANQKPDFAVATQRQQRAFADKHQRLRIGRDLDSSYVRLARGVSARALHPGFYKQIDVSTHRCIEFEPMSGFIAAVGGNIVQRQRLRFGQDLVTDFAVVGPFVGLLVVFILPGTVQRKHESLHLTCKSLLGNRRTAGQQQHLFGLVAGVVN